MTSNFEFLNRYWPALYQLGSLAEKYLFSDPNACIFKLGAFGERVVDEIFQFENLAVPGYDDSQAARVRMLKQEGLLPQKDELLQGSKEQLAQQSELLQKRETELKAQEQLIAELTAKINAVQTAVSDTSREERVTHSEQAAAKAGMTEAETRMLIDQQLRDAGWEADTIKLRYSKGARPVKGKNLAIAEWPTTALDTGDKGRADYALFIGLKLYGIVEAKRANKGISAILDHQCREYARSLRPEDEPCRAGSVRKACSRCTKRTSPPRTRVWKTRRMICSGPPTA